MQKGVSCHAAGDEKVEAVLRFTDKNEPYIVVKIGEAPDEVVLYVSSVALLTRIEEACLSGALALDEAQSALNIPGFGADLSTEAA